MAAPATSLLFYVNSRRIVVRDAEPETTLLTYLRNSGLRSVLLLHKPFSEAHFFD